MSGPGDPKDTPHRVDGGRGPGTSFEMPVLQSQDVVELVGGYPIVRLIGVGAMGRVFECVDAVAPAPDRGRHVAVKVLHTEYAADPVFMDRLKREGIMMGSIRSAHVAQLYAVGEHDGAPFLVMELLAGEDLETRLRRDRTIPAREALGYARDAVRGLKAAFESGILHRDVKPSNLIVDAHPQRGSRVKLTDFGMARPIAGSAHLSGRGLLAGTPAFMAPELVKGLSGDPRSDMYSLGATLFMLLTGRQLFDKDNPIDVIVAHVSEEPPPLTTFLPGASANVVSLVKRLLAKEPAGRFRNYDELLSTIEDALRGGPVSRAVSANAATVIRHLEETDPDKSVPPDPFAPVPSSAGYQVGAPTGVMGSLRQMSVPEIVQTLEIGRKTATVEVQPQEPDGNGEPVKGALGTKNGQVVYAKLGALVGDEAFFALSMHKNGFFRIHYGDDPKEQNIQKPTQFLMLEAMRRADEQGASKIEVAAQKKTSSGPAFPAVVVSRPSQPPPAHGPAQAPKAALPGAAPSPMWAIGDGLPKGARPMGPVGGSSSSKTGAAKVAAPAPVAIGDGFAAPPHTTPADGVFGEVTQEVSGRFVDDMTMPEVGAAGGVTQRIERPKPAGPDARERAIAALRRAAPVVAQVARRGAASLGAGYVGARRSLVGALPAAAGPLARVEAVVPPPWPMLLPLSAVVVLALGIGLALFGGGVSTGDALADIEGGRAPEVLAAIDAKPPRDRTGDEHVVRGHALVSLGRAEDALDAYRAAVEKGTADPRALDFVLGRLQLDEPDRALDILVAWPDAKVKDRLVALTKDESWNVRHHAVTALEEREEAFAIDLEAVALLDLTTGASCKDRRQGLALLKRAGQTQAALDAIKKAGTRDDNDCMTRELEPTWSAVSKRTKKDG